MEETIVNANKLKKYFPIKEGIFSSTKEYIKAVDNVDIQIRKGETFGLVGESGCGKTTLGRILIHLVPPTAGTLLFMGSNLMTIKKSELLKLRPHMQIVFQDPSSSLNPRMTVKTILGEPLKINKRFKGEALNTKVLELLNIVGLDIQHMYRYPHEFSGGQKQRIGVARALALNPDFIVLDEPTSSLDVSVQAQILNLFKDLQEKFQLTYLFITHDLSVIKYISDRVGVMYAGKIVECAPTKDLFWEQLHPYTKALLSAIPIPDPRMKRKHIHLKGEVPSLINPPTGCRFHPRCPYAMPKCSEAEPELKEFHKDHFVACYLY
ncbi:MAG: ABC transporter ATP-binding protein [Candidatus Thermoplasmatota archaeon]|jgi:oligopeptide/dipeptide ABC transporter ATP-binding protein|nr:ABC transporter ATP-binding protein [Candidatus Thermoplasmatota archaeon]